MAAACVVTAPLLVRVVYGPSFIAAAPALVWIGVGLIPALSNGGRKIFLYAAGREAVVVRWSAVSLIVQAASAAVLIPVMGSTGAAISLALSESVVWLPLRRASLPHPEPDLQVALTTSA
jgi:O-antigen/teichoic acid export membrane protein